MMFVENLTSGLAKLSVAAMLIFALAGCDQWRVFHHDPLHTGRSGVDTSSSPGAVVWEIAVPQGAESPAVIAGDTVYVGTDTGGLLAVSFNGTQQWQFPTSNAIVATPAVAPDGTIYVGSKDDNFYAITPAVVQKWMFATGGATVLLSKTNGSDGFWVFCGSRHGHAAGAVVC